MIGILVHELIKMNETRTRQDERALALKLAAEADVDHRTAARWLRGEEVRERTGDRLELAARTLGVMRTA